MAPDARGWIDLEPVRLSVGLTRDRRGGYERLACYDPATGQELGDYTAVMQILPKPSANPRTRSRVEAVRGPGQ